ncbi:uncharacterized protein LOC112465909 [Temnothorax curvispinosus]|uniref:Uncharacterized protein LOC112465909 n=1 Tax=Temnothorax curvispinosus TaxID=300111 RepID=A0A6J1R5M0_9HYME|nr:uncharacterized protein LOC112465909 [Temnothorax curvispinosus]
MLYQRPGGVYFPGFRTVNSRNLLGSGGVSISVRAHLEFDILPVTGLPPGYDVIGIRTKNLLRNLNVVTLYRHPRGRISRRDFQSIFQAVSDSAHDTIILGDFNAKNVVWNCHSTDDSGDVLLDLMSDEDFYYVNSDTRSRNGFRGQRDSNLDLMFGTEGILNRIDYRQMEDTWDSDHFPISFAFDNSTQIYRKISNRLSSKRTDWSRFRDLVEDEIISALLPNIDSFKQDFEFYYSHFINILKKSIAIASGRREDAPKPSCPEDPAKRKRSHRWWDVECDEAVRQRKSAFAEFRKSKSLHAWIEYKRLKALAKRTINKKKKENFEKFCGSINRFTSLSYVCVYKRILQYNAYFEERE